MAKEEKKISYEMPTLEITVLLGDVITASSEIDVSGDVNSGGWT